MSTTYTMVIDGETVRGELDIDEQRSSNAGPEFLALLNADIAAKGFSIKFGAKRFNYKPTVNDGLSDPVYQQTQLPIHPKVMWIVESDLAYEAPLSVLNVTIARDGGTPQHFNGITLSGLNDLINTGTNTPFLISKYTEWFPNGDFGGGRELELGTPAISQLIQISMTVVSGGIHCESDESVSEVFMDANPGDTVSFNIYRSQTSPSYPQYFGGTDGPSAEYIPTQIFVSGDANEIYMPRRESNLGTGYGYQQPYTDKMDINSKLRFPITINLSTRQTVLGYNRNYQLPDLDEKQWDSKIMAQYPHVDQPIDNNDGVRLTVPIDNLSYDHVSTYDGRIPVKMFVFTVSEPRYVVFDNMGTQNKFGFNGHSSNNLAFMWVADNPDFNDANTSAPGEPDGYTESNFDNRKINAYGRWMLPGYYYLMAVSNDMPYGDLTPSSFDYRSYSERTPTGL